jgi:hypothetical protein
MRDDDDWRYQIFLKSQAAAPPQAPPPPENPAEVEARRLRQLALQEDAARTLGKNAGTHSPKSSMLHIT